MPFDYGTTAARDLVDKLNEGLTSRTKKAQLRPTCEGVIFEGQLYYWVKQHDVRNQMVGDGYFIDTWKPDRGRPSLHHIIWERTNRRKTPAG